MFIEEEGYYILSESWIGYNASQDADYFIQKPILWVKCPICDQEFSPEHPIHACHHYVDFCGSTVLFNDLEVEDE